MSEVTPARRSTRARKPSVDPKYASRVHEALYHAEHSLDQAFIATAELTTLLPSLRGQTNLAFCVGQDAIKAGTVAISTLTQARADLQRMHDELAGLRSRLRIPATMDGPWPEDKDRPDTGG